MYDHDRWITQHSPCLCASCDPLRDWAQNHRKALLNAAALLGGRSSTARAHSVLDALSGQPISTLRLRVRLDDLLDLLMLEHVHYEARPEAACFAALDPWDPIVEDLCLLADGLQDAIDAWDAAHDDDSNVVADRRNAA